MSRCYLLRAREMACHLGSFPVLIHFTSVSARWQLHCKKRVANKVSKRLSASKRFSACCKNLNLTSHIKPFRYLLEGCVKYPLCKAVACRWRAWVQGSWRPRLAPTPKYLKKPEPRTARGVVGVGQIIARVYSVPYSAGRLTIVCAL